MPVQDGKKEADVKEKISLLVVEDREDHMADFLAMLAEETERLPVRLDVLCATDLAEAFRLLPQADAVISDVFFPAAPGEKEGPSGAKLIDRCIEEKRPVVWITSTYHHGPKTHFVNEYGRDRGLEMFDAASSLTSEQKYDSIDHEASHKPWKKALYGLFFTIVALEMGNMRFEDHALKILVAYGDDAKYKSYGNAVNRGVARFFRSDDILNAEEQKDDTVLLRMVELGFLRH